MEIETQRPGLKSDTEITRERLSRLAWLLDSSIPIPGLKFSVGLDAIVGLLPGIGDAIGVLLSSYILREAARLGAPKTVVVRMAINLMIDGVIGIVPFAGDLFDAAWKANVRNVKLLGAYLDNPRKTRSASAGFVFIVFVLVVAFLVATGAAGFFVLRWIWHAIGS